MAWQLLMIMTEQLLIITKAYVKESVNEESFFLLILFSIQGKNVSVFFFLKKSVFFLFDNGKNPSNRYIGNKVCVT